MSIDKFSKSRFEQELTQIFHGWEYLGFDAGEEVYAIPVTTHARIKVRSSIDGSGFAADTGEDSIRLWIEVFQPSYRDPKTLDWKATGKKVDAYTTRVRGWEGRMNEKIHTLWDRAHKVQRTAKVCDCGKTKWVGFSKSEKNKDRPYAKCFDCGMSTFEWLDTPFNKGEVVTFETPTQDVTDTTGNGKDPNEEWLEMKTAFAEREAEQERQAYQTKMEMETQLETEDEERKKRMAEAKVAKAQLLKTHRTTRVERQPEPVQNGKKEPNPSQVAAIEADVDADVRLMAPPGSGKTFVIEHRYAYLVDQGIDPKRILVVTFAKKMADEMLERIHRTTPSAERTQISTIHALCYRILTIWDDKSPYYKWEVPKDWAVKKAVEELIERHWEKKFDDEEDPSVKEILQWLDTSKYSSLTVEQSRQWFIDQVGEIYGESLYKIRRDLDQKMARNKWMRFADMLYYTEQLIMNNLEFRRKWQSRFSHVIVDESQDTNYQAMRILITLSMSGGQSVYTQ